MRQGPCLDLVMAEKQQKAGSRVGPGTAEAVDKGVRSPMRRPAYWIRAAAQGYSQFASWHVSVSTCCSEKTSFNIDNARERQDYYYD